MLASYVVFTQSGVLQRQRRPDECELHKAVEAFGLFTFDVIGQLNVNFTGNLNRQIGRVEAGNFANTVFALFLGF